MQAIPVTEIAHNVLPDLRTLLVDPTRRWDSQDESSVTINLHCIRMQVLRSNYYDCPVFTSEAITIQAGGLVRVFHSYLDMFLLALWPHSD